MGKRHWPATGRDRRQVAVGRNLVAWMTTHSFVLYATIMVAQRAWTLLNSDVGQLLRRL